MQLYRFQGSGQVVEFLPTGKIHHKPKKVLPPWEQNPFLV